MMPKLRRRSTDERTGTMTLIEHLEELRHRVVLAFVALLGGAVVGWFLYPTFINIVTRPFCDYVMSLPADQRPPTGVRPRRERRARPVLGQAQGGLRPRAVRGAAGDPVPAVGVHRAGAHEPRAPDGGAVHRLVDGAVRPRRVRRLPHAAARAGLPPRVRGDKFTNLISGSSFIGFVVAADARVRALVRVPDPADLPGAGRRAVQREAPCLAAVRDRVRSPCSPPSSRRAPIRTRCSR